MEIVTRVRENVTRLAAMSMVAGLLAVSLVACGGDPATPTPTAAPTAEPTATTAAPSGSTDGGGTAQEVKASLKEWAIVLPSTEVSAGKVKYTVTNDGQVVHDLVIYDASGNTVGSTPRFNKDQNPQTLEVDLKPGTYTYVCDLPGHAEQGMKATVTVK
jgi:plastocyanin